MNAQAAAPPVVFLDIDGVLLPRKAWALPANVAHAAAMRKAGPRHSGGHAALGTAFDPVAVALVNRLCERTGARLVVHSNWRRNVGLPETRAKLVAQGIAESHFHEDWACRWARSSEKHHDVGWWLDDHRVNPCIEGPERLFLSMETAEAAAHAAAMEAWEQSRADHGIRFVILEDEDMGRFEHRRIATDFGEGFALADYRRACGALGGSDPAMGVHPVAAEDLARVLQAWDGDELGAAGWLHGSDTWSNAVGLDAALARREDEAMRMFGYGSGAADAGEESRARVWSRLDALRRERDALPDAFRCH